MSISSISSSPSYYNTNTLRNSQATKASDFSGQVAETSSTKIQSRIIDKSTLPSGHILDIIKNPEEVAEEKLNALASRHNSFKNTYEMEQKYATEGVARAQKWYDVQSKLLAQLGSNANDQQRAIVESAAQDVQYYQDYLAGLKEHPESDQVTQFELKFVSTLTGKTIEEVQHLYQEKIDKLEKANAENAEKAAIDAAESAKEAEYLRKNGTLRERFGWTPSGIHTEIRVNGETIGVIFNDGTSCIENEYTKITEPFGWGGVDEVGLSGPKQAEKRIAQFTKALKEAGYDSNPDISEDLKSLLKGANIEAKLASTAMTQAEWLLWQTTGSQPAGHHVDRSA